LVMVNFEGLLCRVWETTLRVDRMRVSGSCRVQDAGTNFTAYFSHSNMLFYFASYGLPDTFHYIKGPASISAFNGQQSNRASYAARVTPQLIGTSVVSRGGVIQVVQNQVRMTDTENSKFLFVICIWLLRHWDEERRDHIKIDTTRGDKAEFAEELNRMKARLVARQLLPVGLVDPVEEVQLNVVDVGNRRGVVRHDMDYMVNATYPDIATFAELLAIPQFVDPNALWQILDYIPQQPGSSAGSSSGAASGAADPGGRTGGSSVGGTQQAGPGHQGDSMED
ncbi:unnamed protein product, partial [Mucor fragilis]